MAEDWRDTLETHKARYRERIIDAAIELVAQEGVAKVSMAALAQRAGIGRATVYKYFPDVEHALLAHVERDVDECRQTLVGVLAQQEDPVLRLRSCIDALVGYFASQRHRIGWVTLEQADLSSTAVSRLRALMGSLPLPFVETIAAGVADGALRSDLRPDVHGLLIFKMVVSLHDHLVTGQLTQEDAAATVWQLISEGVLPRVHAG